MSCGLCVVEKNCRFIVTENDKPIQLPKSDGSCIVTEFTSKDDAEKYISILQVLRKQKKYANT